MAVLLKAPDGLTRAEALAYQWAISGLEDALRDSCFIADNPGVVSDVAEQMDDILYRLEEQAKEMGFLSGENDGFSRVCKRVAVKLRKTGC